MAIKETKIIMVTDNGTITYITDDINKPITRDNLRGDSILVKKVNDILNDVSIFSVPIAWTNYCFTINRIELSDMVAAMHSIGNGRGLLNDEGWEVLNDAMPELVDPENNRDDVIY